MKCEREKPRYGPINLLMDFLTTSRLPLIFGGRERTNKHGANSKQGQPPKVGGSQSNKSEIRKPRIDFSILTTPGMSDRLVKWFSI